MENQPAITPFFFQKCWQAETSVVWQASDHSRRKFYFILDYRQKKHNIRVTQEKPSDITSHSNFTSMLRKHLPSSQLVSIIYDDRTDIWLFLKKPGEKEATYLVRLQKVSPPLLSLIDPTGKILCRMSHQQILTKATQLDVAIPDHKLFIERLPEIQTELSKTESDEQELPESTPLLSTEQIDASRRLRRKRKTVHKSYEDHLKKIDQDDKIGELSRQAGLLAANLHLIPKGSAEWQAEGQSLKLDAKITPGQNLSLLFKKIKRLQRQQENAQSQVKILVLTLQELDEDIQRFNREPLSSVEIHTVLRHFRIPLKKHVAQQRSVMTANLPKYRIFRLSPMWSAWVGKSAVDNDLLTKQAKSNDYWLHVNAVAGSHIILKTAKAGLILNETILRQACILALHFSKLSPDLSGEVCVTQKMHLKKPKASPPGKWNIMQAKNHFIRYSSSELEDLLHLEELG